MKERKLSIRVVVMTKLKGEKSWVGRISKAFYYVFNFPISIRLNFFRVLKNEKNIASRAGKEKLSLRLRSRKRECNQGKSWVKQYGLALCGQWVNTFKSKQHKVAWKAQTVAKIEYDWRSELWLEEEGGNIALSSFDKREFKVCRTDVV